MKAVVVYESMFGNKRRIAGAIGEALGDELDVQVLEVGNAGRGIERVDLLVVGGPAAATFDTALKMRWLPHGSAARGEARRGVWRGIG